MSARLTGLLLLIPLAGCGPDSKGTAVDEKGARTARDSGHAWLEKKEYDKAIQDFDEAIRLDPKDSFAFSYRGIAWYSKEEYDKAIQDFDEAIRLGPKYPHLFYHRGLAWFHKKEYDKAIRDFDEAIRLDPKLAIAFHDRGYMWFHKKEYDKAIQDFDEAIRLDPRWASVFNYRGIAWLEKKEYDKAFKDFDEAIRLVPKYAPALNNKAYVLAACADDRLRDVARAQELMETVVALRPTSPYNEETLGVIAAARGRFDDAIQHQKKALEDKEYAGNEERKAKAEKRLKQYEQKQPWLE
jgi:tetratricopeptide (TPR) repeat protein